MESERPAISPSQWLVLRPALSAAALIVAGLGVHEWVIRAAFFWTLILMGATGAACMWHRRPRLGGVAIGLGLFAGGVAGGQLESFHYNARDIAMMSSATPRLARVQLCFDDPPHVSTDAERHRAATQSGRARVVAVQTRDGWVAAQGNVLFTAPATTPPIAAGQIVRAIGMLGRIGPAMNPGEFDWEHYYRRERLLCTLHLVHAEQVATIVDAASSRARPAMAAVQMIALTSQSGDPDSPPLFARVRQWLGSGFSDGRQVDRALLQALLLGDRGPALRAVERDFRATGASHLLSSSGLRMAVLAAIFYGVARLLRLPPMVCAALVAAAVTAWGTITLPTAQALRPVVGAAAIGLGLALRRPAGGVQILAVTALIILIARPSEIRSAGFQLSFTIVLGMLLLARPALHFANGQRVRDEDVLEKLGKLSTRQRVRHRVGRALVNVLVVSTVAWLVAIPLVAWHFEQFTPWAVPIGIILSPVVIAVLVLGFIKILLSAICPPLAAPWAWAPGVAASVLRHGIHWATYLPGVDIPVGRPASWIIVLFYALLLMPFVPARRRAARWGLRCGPVAALIVLLMPQWAGAARCLSRPAAVRVTLLAVGAGQCAVIETPTTAFMIDAGSSALPDPLHDCIEPFLHHQGRRNLSRIFLSHGDYDHISAADAAFDECGHAQVIDTPFLSVHATQSVTCRRLLDDLRSAGQAPTHVVAGTTIAMDDGSRLTVLWPPADCNMNSNNAGMVVRLECGGRAILFPADIQDPAMAELLKHPAALKSDVLVAAHHGSSESLTARFVAAVDPKVIVSSDAERLTKKQRDFAATIDRRPLYRTGTCGAIEIDIEPPGRIRVEPFRHDVQRGWIVEADGRGHTE